jgi:hypothetical protein
MLLAEFTVARKYRPFSRNGGEYTWVNYTLGGLSVGIPLPLRDNGCKQYWTDVQYGTVFLAKILHEAARNLAKRSQAHTRPVKIMSERKVIVH